jgi:hypothetical protein
MKPGLIFVASGFILLATVSALAQSPGQAATIGALQVKEITLSEIDQSHIRIAVNLSMVPAQSVTLNNLRLCSLRLNGQPVFAEPLKQDIPLKKGVTIALPALYVTILFRDLYSAEPLTRMISNQKVHVEGDMVTELKLNVMEKLALGSEHPMVAIALDQDVPAATGTSELERSLALSVLSLVDIGIKNKAIAAGIVGGSKPAWIAGLEQQASANLFVVESSYKLAQGDRANPVYLLEFGFQIAPSIVLTTAEANAPWKYDVEFQAAVNSGQAKMAKNSYEVALWPAAGGDTAYHLSGKDFDLQVRGTPLQDQITEAGARPGEGTVLRRNSPGVLAILKLKSPTAVQGFIAAPSAVAGEDSWDQVVVFRRRDDPATGKPKVEALQLAARRDGNGIRLSQPVDEAVYGSPIVTKDGVLGMVQDEQSGTFLPPEMYNPGPQLDQTK